MQFLSDPAAREAFPFNSICAYRYQRTCCLCLQWSFASHAVQRFPVSTVFYPAIMGGQFSPSYNTRAFILSGAGIFLILLLLFHSSSSSSRSPLFETEKHKVLKRNWSVIAKDSPLEGPSPDFEKPEGFKIVGLIFYGRRATVSILDCYLQASHRFTPRYEVALLTLLHLCGPTEEPRSQRWFS